MSDLMFYGVLREPYETAMGDELSRFQFYRRAQEAADRVEKAERELAELRAAHLPKEAERDAEPPDDLRDEDWFFHPNDE